MGRSKRHFLQAPDESPAWPSSQGPSPHSGSYLLRQPSSRVRASLLVSWHCCLAGPHPAKARTTLMNGVVTLFSAPDALFGHDVRSIHLLEADHHDNDAQATI